MKQKEAAQKAVTDLAAEMIELQAARDARPGIAFPSDTEWQREFDAAFPYQETPDQLTSIDDIKRDMQATRPMDRLLCGDVGFGKTELAIRAAFKAIDAGYQVAVLVPTTMLAEQHRRTFTARMAEFPFQIDAISRFCTAKEQREIIERAAAGKLDVLIGTHRMASPDVTFAESGAVDHRRGAAVWRGGEGAAEGAAVDGGRAHDDGDADSADAAYVAAWACGRFRIWRRRRRIGWRSKRG